MITEDYISFENAKLLKEKGFDEGCHTTYDYRKQFHHDSFYAKMDQVRVGLYLWAPTVQRVMKWLREVHKIFITINMIPDTIKKPYFFKPYVGGKIYNFPLDYSVEFYTTYEEACDAAIKYCLENLI